MRLFWQVFRTDEGQKLTLVVLEMDIVDEAEGQLEVWDGQFEWNDKIGTYPIINGTLPQGMTVLNCSVCAKKHSIRFPFHLLHDVI